MVLIHLWRVNYPSDSRIYLPCLGGFLHSETIPNNAIINIGRHIVNYAMMRCMRFQRILYKKPRQLTFFLVKIEVYLDDLKRVDQNGLCHPGSEAGQREGLKIKH
jgi:hypothetical protein